MPRLPLGSRTRPASSCARKPRQILLAELADPRAGRVDGGLFGRETDSHEMRRLPPERGAIQHRDFAPLVESTHEFISRQPRIADVQQHEHSRLWSGNADVGNALQAGYEPLTPR